MVNGVAIPYLGTPDVAASIANHPSTVASSGIISLSVNDLVSIAVLNETAAHAITVTNAAVTILSI